MTLIDLDDLIARLDYSCSENEKVSIGFLKDYLTHYIPVVETKQQGCWTVEEDAYEDVGCFLDGYRCSECGEVTDYPYNFCPHCGNPMNGEKANEKW